MNETFPNKSIFHNLYINPNAYEKKKTTINYKYLNNEFDNNLFETKKFNIPPIHQIIEKNKHSQNQRENHVIHGDSSKKIKSDSKKKYSNKLVQIGFEKDKIQNFEEKFYKPKRKNTYEYKTKRFLGEQNTFSSLNSYKNKKFESMPKRTYSEKMKRLEQLN